MTSEFEAAARKAFEQLRTAAGSALNSIYLRGPLAGLSGWQIIEIAEGEGWGRWDGQYDEDDEY